MDNYENNNQNGAQGFESPEYQPQEYQPQEYQAQGYQQPQQNYQPQGYEPQSYQQPQQNYQPQNYAAQQYDPMMSVEAPQSKNDGKAIASMVLGIVSLACCGGFYACPIVGLVLGIISKKNKPNNNGMAVAGIVMCCIALGFMVLYTILALAGVITYPFSGSTYRSIYY